MCSPTFLFPYHQVLPIVRFRNKITLVDGNFLQALLVNIEKQMDAARIAAQEQQNKSGKKQTPGQYIHDMVIIKGKLFYGYDDQEHSFIKISLYNPKHASKMSAMLASGSILGHKFSIFEAHIPYILQFLMDHNLVGMGYMNIKSCFFRSPLPVAFSEQATLQHVSPDVHSVIYTNDTVHSKYLFPSNIGKISQCNLEIDVAQQGSECIILLTH